MNKPRLSSCAMEFYFKYRDYFELRCNNIDSGDDTEYGNTNNSIIYTSPLDGAESFRHKEPMFVSNFKINQAFLQDKVILPKKIYDHLGDPFYCGIQYCAMEYYCLKNPTPNTPGGFGYRAQWGWGSGLFVL